MLLPIVIAAFVVASVSGNGEFIVLHSPDSVEFKGHDPVKESVLPEVFSASLGFTTRHYSNWNGLFIENPFTLPEAVVAVFVDGVSDIGISKGHHFPLRTNEEDLDIYASLEKRVVERFPEGNSQLLRVNLEDGPQEYQFIQVKQDKSQKPKHHQLRLNVDEDRAFLKDIALFNGIIDALAAPRVNPHDNIPDVFCFKIETLHALSDLHGENSTQVKEAKQILAEAILRLNAAFVKLYDGKVVVSVVSSDAVHTRRTRSILAAGDETVPKINPAKAYSKDYPVIFNIILWFGVALFFSVLAVCVAIASMDPGRDSIIYRMTSTRLKKDN